MFVQLRFAPGEAFQFDQSEDCIKVNKVKANLQIAHFKPRYSLANFMRVKRAEKYRKLGANLAIGVGRY